MLFPANLKEEKMKWMQTGENDTHNDINTKLYNILHCTVQVQLEGRAPSTVSLTWGPQAIAIRFRPFCGHLFC